MFSWSITPGDPNLLYSIQPYLTVHTFLPNPAMVVPSVHVADLGALSFSKLIVGFWRLQEWKLSSKALLGYIHASLDQGITTFDHAAVYGEYTCEKSFGDALAIMPALRERMQIVTKCGIRLAQPGGPNITYYDTSKEHIIESAENSLRNLRTDRIDVLLIHRPDPLLDPDEVAQAFDELYQSGKVRYFGVSNFLPWQVDLLSSRLELPVVTNQIEVSVMHLDPLHDGTLDHCHRNRIAPMAWSPFAGGRLFADDEPRAARVRAALQQVGDELGGASVDQVALAWLLAHPAGILPVIGTGNRERIRAAAASVELSLSREQWFTIWCASAGSGVP